jgi:hypothetical protein
LWITTIIFATLIPNLPYSLPNFKIVIHRNGKKQCSCKDLDLTNYGQK